MTTTPEAYKLLSIPNAGLSNGEFSESGTLDLECVSVPIPPSYSASKEKDESGPGADHQVYLVLRLNAFEVALDPQRTARRVDQGGFRQYVMEGTINDPSQLVVSFALSSSMAPGVEEDMETFEGILAGYVASFQSPQTQGFPSDSKTPPTMMTRSLPQTTDTTQDLRGHLVMMNEQTGEIVGQVNAPHMRIHEDPSMYAPGHLNDPIYIEIPDGALTTAESDANAFETFAVLVPPDQQNWMTRGASLIGHAIEMGTSLLVTTVEAAAGYYVKNSKPSPHHPASGASTPAAVSEKGPGGGPPSPLPPRPKALVFLTSPRTRANLQKAHGVSAEAVKISSKTINLIDSMIRRAMGANPKRQKYFAREEGEARISTPASLGLTPGPPLPPRSPSPFSFGGKEKSAAAGGPPLPPRSPSPLPPRSSTLPTSFPTPQHYPSPGPSSGPQGQFQAHPEGLAASPHPTQQPKLTTKARILISLDLLWSVTDASTRRILDTGTTELGRVVGHKYGDEARESSLLMAGTARNVGLVYIDMTGIGRRAILKRAGKTYVKKQLGSRPVPPVPSATPKQ